MESEDIQLLDGGKKKFRLKLAVNYTISFIFCIFALIACIAIVTIVVVISSAKEIAPSDSLERAKFLASKRAPLIDGHNDLSEKLLGIFKNNEITKEGFKKFPMRNGLSKEQDELLLKNGEIIQSTIPKMKEGSHGGQFWAVYVNCKINGSEAVELALEGFNVIHEMNRFYPDFFQPVKNSNEILEAFKHQKFISMIGVEGGKMINNDLNILREYWELGARYLTLTHNCNTDWADSCCDKDGPLHNGLTAFGKTVIKEMNKIGMMVDLSHTSLATMEDAIEVSTAPVMFSHSNAFAICSHERNVRDDVLQKLKENKGIIMMNFYGIFVSEAERLAHIEIAQKFPNNVTEKMLEWKRDHPLDRASIEKVADHIDYIKEKIGIDHLGIGSDFDGVGLMTTFGLEDTSKYMHLIAELINRGYSDSDIKKIMSENLIRVMGDVEKESLRLNTESNYFL